MLLFMVRLTKIKFVFVCSVGTTRTIPKTTSGAIGTEEKASDSREREAERDGVWRYLLCFTLQKQSITEHEGTLYTLHKWGAFVTFDFGTNLSREKRLAFL
jgi:hypothetical protein